MAFDEVVCGQAASFFGDFLKQVTRQVRPLAGLLYPALSHPDPGFVMLIDLLIELRGLHAPHVQQRKTILYIHID
jgi:hypothetical protein